MFIPRIPTNHAMMKSLLTELLQFKFFHLEQHQHSSSTATQLFSSRFLLKKLKSAKRMDIIWDAHQQDLLKKSTREKRGSGLRRKVMPTTQVPQTGTAFYVWMLKRQNYFNYWHNKQWQGEELYSIEPTWPSWGLVLMTEEADTHIFLQVKDAYLSRHQRIMIRTSDEEIGRASCRERV